MAQTTWRSRLRLRAAWQMQSGRDVPASMEMPTDSSTSSLSFLLFAKLVWNLAILSDSRSKYEIFYPLQIWIFRSSKAPSYLDCSESRKQNHPVRCNPYHLQFFSVSRDGSIRLLDGDKIAALLAKFLVDELQQSGLDQLPEIGVVQTAYANGASTKFLQQLLACLFPNYLENDGE